MITKGKLIFQAEMLTLLSFLVISSCQKELSPGDPPKLPPSEAFHMNFISFPNPDDSISLKLNSESFENTSTYINWEHAYHTISEWNAIANFPIALTTACYLEALKVEPLYLGSNSFGWSCNFIYQDAFYSARLVANWVANLEFKLEMYIAKPGLYGYNRFKWLEGTIRHDWSHGILTIYESPSNPLRILRIEWNKNLENNTGDIKYTNLKQGPIPSGSFIQFKSNSEAYFDANYTVSRSGNKIEIEWNRSNNAGRISDPLKYNGTGAWQCWTEFLQDTVCE
jgi:hypothetical protein